jgi:hypothetical protein
MPTYTFFNTETGEHFEEFFTSFKAKDEYLKDNLEIQQTLTTGLPLIDPTRLGRVKPSNEFRDRLKEIKKNNGRNSTINTW